MASGKSIWVKIFGDNKDLKKKLNDSGKDVDRFGDKIKKIGGLVAAAFSIQAIGNFAKESMRLANEMEGVSAAFDRIGDQKALEKMREATKGTVTDLELMRRSVMASNFGISQSALPKLFEFATKRAQETGQSVDYLVDSIVTGLGRKSPLILDNLGITTIQLQEALGGTAMAAASVGELTEAAAKVATKELEAMGEITETNAIRLEQLATQWANLKTDIGKGVSTLWLESVDALVTGVEVLSTKQLSFWEKLASIGNPSMKLYAEAMMDVREEMEKVVDETDPANRLLAQAAEDRRKEAEAAARAAEERARAEDEYQKEFRESLETLSLYNLALERRIRLEDGARKFSIEAAEKNIEAIEGEIDALADLEEGFEKVNTITKESSDIFSDLLVNSLSMAAVSFGEAIGGAGSLADALTDVTSAVMESIGQIMVATGAAMGPAGVPLVLAGLATMGVGAFAGVVGQRDAAMVDIKNAYAESGIKASARDIRRMHRYNRIHANDIATANDYAVDFNNRVG